MKVAAALTALIVAGMLAGCTNNNAEGTDVAVKRVTVNGKTIDCIVMDGTSSGGISCDWEHPR